MCVVSQTDSVAAIYCCCKSEGETGSNWCDTRYCSVSSGAHGVVVDGISHPALSLSPLLLFTPL